MIITLQTIGTAIGVISGISGLVIAVRKSGYNSAKQEDERKQILVDIKSIKESLTNLSSRVYDVENRARDTSLKIEPFWGLIMTNLPQLLNVSHSDNLVGKLTNDTITDEELRHLEEELNILLVEDREKGNSVFVDLMALWATNVKKKERGLT